MFSLVAVSSHVLALWPTNMTFFCGSPSKLVPTPRLLFLEVKLNVTLAPMRSSRPFFDAHTPPTSLLLSLLLSSPIHCHITSPRSLLPFGTPLHSHNSPGAFRFLSCIEHIGAQLFLLSNLTDHTQADL